VATAQIQEDAPWNLDRLDQARLPLDQKFHYNNLGSGVYAYIVDTVPPPPPPGKALSIAPFPDRDVEYVLLSTVQAVFSPSLSLFGLRVKRCDSLYQKVQKIIFVQYSFADFGTFYP